MSLWLVTVAFTAVLCVALPAHGMVLQRALKQQMPKFQPAALQSQQNERFLTEELEEELRRHETKIKELWSISEALHQQSQPLFQDANTNIGRSSTENPTQDGSEESESEPEDEDIEHHIKDHPRYRRIPPSHRGLSFVDDGSHHESHRRKHQGQQHYDKGHQLNHESQHPHDEGHRHNNEGHRLQHESGHSHEGGCDCGDKTNGHHHQHHNHQHHGPDHLRHVHGDNGHLPHSGHHPPNSQTHILSQHESHRPSHIDCDKNKPSKDDHDPHGEDSELPDQDEHSEPHNAGDDSRTKPGDDEQSPRFLEESDSEAMNPNDENDMDNDEADDSTPDSANTNDSEDSTNEADNFRRHQRPLKGHKGKSKCKKGLPPVLNWRELRNYF